MRTGTSLPPIRNACAAHSFLSSSPVPVPFPILQGDYGLQVIARGMDGSELACVNVEFSLVMPEGAIGSSGSGSSSSSRGSGSRKAMRAVW